MIEPYRPRRTGRVTWFGFSVDIFRKKSSPKLMRAWRGPHRVAHVLQDRRVYILGRRSGLKLDLKPEWPSEFTTTPLDTGKIAVKMDTEPERFVEAKNDDFSQLSYTSEQ